MEERISASEAPSPRQKSSSMRARENQTSLIFAITYNFATRRFSIKHPTKKLFYLTSSRSSSPNVFSETPYLSFYRALNSALIELYFCLGEAPSSYVGRRGLTLLSDQHYAFLYNASILLIQDQTELAVGSSPGGDLPTIDVPTCLEAWKQSLTSLRNLSLASLGDKERSPVAAQRL